MIKIKRLLKSFSYAFRGLLKVLKEEQNFQIQGLLVVVVIFLAWFFQIKRLEWGLLVLTISLVILMEIINSAVERVTDVLRPRINDYVKEIKDIAAAAVMIASIAAIINGLIIFTPYVLELLKT